MSYTLTVDGLKLPTLNKVIRWDWRSRQREVDRVRLLVSMAANKAGYGTATPLRRATVSIRAFGPYQRRDSDATCFKFALDSIVARPIRVAGIKTDEHEWGLILDDNRETI